MTIGDFEHVDEHYIRRDIHSFAIFVSIILSYR